MVINHRKALTPFRLTKFHYTNLFFLLLLLHVAAGVYFDSYSWWWILFSLLVYLLVLAAGSYFIQWNFYFPSQNRLPSLKVSLQKGKIGFAHSGKQVALSFDDGPSVHTEEVLDILKKEQVVATFFLIGKNINGQENLLKRMVAEGHSLGNHSFYHRGSFDWQSTQKMRAELEKTNEAITAVTERKVCLFRPPFGVTNPNLGKAINSLGLRSIGWNVRSYDTIARNEKRLLQRILQKVKPGSILLLHDRCAITASILPELVKQLKIKGYSFTAIH